MDPSVVVPILIELFGEKILGQIGVKTGVKTNISEIPYNYGNMGITKMVIIRNHDDTPKENTTFTISWPGDKNLEISLKEIGSQSIRGDIVRMDFQETDGKLNHAVYILAGIKPLAILEFDLRLVSTGQEEFKIYVNKFQPITVEHRI